MWPLLTLLLVAGEAGQASWPFKIEFEYAGVPAEFQLCYSSTCVPLSAGRVQGDTWSAPLPMLPEGFQTLTVFACNGGGCTPGVPALSVNVQGQQPIPQPGPPSDPGPGPGPDPGPDPGPPPRPPNGKAPPRKPPKIVKAT